jgi:hypothetical protein
VAGKPASGELSVNRGMTNERRYGELLPALAIASSRVPWYLGREKMMCTSEAKSVSPNTLRKGHDQPAATSVHGWRYHHIGIPTDVPRPGECYLEQFKMYVSAFETSPCGIQWMRFEPDSPVHALTTFRPRLRERKFSLPRIRLRKALRWR